MRRLLIAATTALSALGWASGAAWADLDQTRFMNNICIQNFVNPTAPNQLPEDDPKNVVKGLCDYSATLPVPLDSIKWALWQIVQHSAQEIQALFANQNMAVRIYVIKQPKQTSLITERGKSMGWVQWNANFSELNIGISYLAFDERYSLPIHETAALLELFWWPGTYNSTNMPNFIGTTTSNGYMGSGQLAIYAILAHEIAHFWQAKDSIYPKPQGASSKASCNDKVPLVDNTFAKISWSYWEDGNSSEYFPPWTGDGLWGCGNSTTQSAQDVISKYVPFRHQSSSSPDNNPVNWQDVAKFIDSLYGNTVLPTALAAVSPEEDFAETYTMLALYRAGLRSLCLLVPQTPPFVKAYDVINLLFNAKAAFLAQKVSWVTSLSTAYPADFPVSLAPTDFPTSSSCPAHLPG